MIKKGEMTLEEMAKLIIVFSLIVIFVFIVVKLITPPENETFNSFKTLSSEIKVLVRDLDDAEQSQITVPIFMDKKYIIGSENKDSENSPPSCKGNPCLVLIEKDTLKAVKVTEFKDIIFQQDEYIKIPEKSIINVKITGERKEGGKIISIEQEGS